VRFAVLAGGFGGDGQVADRVKSAESLAARLRVSAECADLALLVAKELDHVRCAPELSPQALLALLRAADAWRRPERLQGLIQACRSVELGTLENDADYPPQTCLRDAFAAASEVDAAAIAAANPGSLRIGDLVQDARLEALRKWRGTPENRERE
jgi:tRNA nucleotidyltransferase (CCA-adding enzyme)